MPACSTIFCLTARLSPKCRSDGNRGRAIFRGATALISGLSLGVVIVEAAKAFGLAHLSLL
jgi:hypothetical protein